MLYHQPVYKEDGHMDGESCVRRAYEYIWNSDFEAAIYWFEQAIAAEPDRASYYHKCAVSCARSGKWLKARQHAESALALEPEHEEYRYHLQIVKARLLYEDAQQLIAAEPPRLLEAEPLLAESAQLDPLSFEASYTLALVYAELDRLDEALASVREALKLEPGHSAARRLFVAISRRRRMARLGQRKLNRKRNR
jgi:tetratricopeptide (TPR) repeat protein